MANGNWLSEQLRGTEWKLLVFGNTEFETIKSLKLIKAEDEALNKAYGLSEGIVLIRPDSYIALITYDLGDVYKYFDKFK